MVLRTVDQSWKQVGKHLCKLAGGVMLLCVHGIASAQLSTQTTTYTLATGGSGVATMTSDSAGAYNGSTGQYHAGTTNTGTITSANGSVYFQVAEYNPAAHAYSQLQSITITIQGGASTTYTPNGTLKITNNGLTSTTYTIQNTTNLELFNAVTGTGISSSSALLGSSATSKTSTTNLVARNGTSAAQSATYTTGYNSNSTTISSGLATYSQLYGGTIYFDLAGISTDTITGGTTKTDASLWSTNATLTITYNWIQVPEPSQWGFIVAGAITSGFALRRRSRRYKAPASPIRKS